MNKKVLYLAGPEVFLPDMTTIRESKLRICEENGFVGDFPVDGEPLPSYPKQMLAKFIALKNQEKIQNCSGVIANITPFRSVSVDPGTAYEIGYATSMKKPVFGYTNCHMNFKNRCIQAFGKIQAGDHIIDIHQIMIEDFDMADNLMIDSAFLNTTQILLAADRTVSIGDLGLFEKTVKEAKKYFG